MHKVRDALYLLWELAVLETTNQVTVAVWSVVDIQEVVVGLDTETVEGKLNNYFRKINGGEGERLFSQIKTK